MCIGNKYGGDDGVGPYIAAQLKNNNSTYSVLNCETIPENYTSYVKLNNPKKLIIIDAAEMNLKPGEIRIITKEKIGVMHISTHGIPISILIKYLEQYVKNIVFIGIQPKTMSGKISKEVKKSGDDLIEIIKNKKIDRIKLLD